MIRSLLPTPLQLHNLSDAQLLSPALEPFNMSPIIGATSSIEMPGFVGLIVVQQSKWNEEHRHWSLGDIRSFFLLASLSWFIILPFLAMCTSSTSTFIFPGHCHLPSRGLLGKFCKIDGSLGFPSQVLLSASLHKEGMNKHHTLGFLGSPLTILTVFFTSLSRAGYNVNPMLAASMKASSRKDLRTFTRIEKKISGNGENQKREDTEWSYNLATVT